MRSSRLRSCSAIATLALAASLPSGADAACALPAKGSDVFAAASTATAVFVGTAQPGPAAAGGVLLSPATFSVQTRLAGQDLGSFTQVTTAVRADGNGGFIGSSELLSPKAGEQWMIVGRRPANAGLPLDASPCDPLTRPVDLDHPREVRIGSRTVTPPPVDLRGRLTGGDAGPLQPDGFDRVPRTTRRITGAKIEAMRVMHGSKVRRVARQSGSTWTTGTLKRGDRIMWLDDRGIWGVRVR